MEFKIKSINYLDQVEEMLNDFKESKIELINYLEQIEEILNDFKIYLKLPVTNNKNQCDYFLYRVKYIFREFDMICEKLNNIIDSGNIKNIDESYIFNMYNDTIILMDKVQNVLFNINTLY